MTTIVTTIPLNPTEYQNFFLNYSEINNVPISLNTYVLQNTSNINVSNTFSNPSGGIYTGPTISPLQTCSYIVKDSNNNFYFTDNQSFFTVPSSVGNYNIYKATVNPNSYSVFISYITDPDLVNSNPIGLAIDNSGFFYVALQTGNKIKKYNSDGTGGTYFISGGSLNGPCGMIFDSNGNLYVANRFSNSILKYNSSGSLISTITNGLFSQPCAININSLGELFVANVNSLLFKVDLTLPITVTQILNNPGRQSVNMAFDFDNNIYLPDFNNDLLYKVIYNSWSYTTQSIYGGGYRLGGIILDRFGDIIIANTNSSGNTVKIDLKFLSYWFTSVNLPKGYNTLKLHNISTNTNIAEFIVFVDGINPNPNPKPEPNPNPGTICFKEGTKILCKLNGEDVYIPIENIEEGTLVKTYKNGYKKCKFNMRELLKNTENHNINNLFRQSKLTNSNLFEDLYITGSHSMLYDNLTEKEEEAMYKLLATYNSKFDIEIPNSIEDKYKLIAYYDKSFTEVKKNINVFIYHLVLESDNNNRNYGIWANGALTESIDEISLLRYLNNSNIKLVNVAKRNNKILNNIFLSKSSMNIRIDNKPLGTKYMNNNLKGGLVLKTNQKPLGTKLMNIQTKFK